MFHPCVRQSPWRREWLPSPFFLTQLHSRVPPPSLPLPFLSPLHTGCRTINYGNIQLAVLGSWDPRTPFHHLLAV